jgi:hypothetical protein
MIWLSTVGAMALTHPAHPARPHRPQLEVNPVLPASR